MRRRLHLVAVILFVTVFILDLAIWGAVPGLPDVGEGIARSARAETLLATTYITLGSALDGLVPALGEFGADFFTRAVGEAFPGIVENPNLAMDAIFSSRFNGTHAWLKTLYWAGPLLFFLAIVLWARKPKTINLVGRR